jgi:hypothetical protein
MREAEMVWEDPPPERRGSAAVIAEQLPYLRNDPQGRWCRLYTYRGNSSAKGAAARFRVEEPDYQFEGRVIAGGGSKLYGRYMGNGHRQ